MVLIYGRLLETRAGIITTFLFSALPPVSTREEQQIEIGLKINSYCRASPTGVGVGGYGGDDDYEPGVSTATELHHTFSVIHTASRDCLQVLPRHPEPEPVGCETLPITARKQS